MLAAVLLIAPDLTVTIIGIVLFAIPLTRQLLSGRRAGPDPGLTHLSPTIRGPAAPFFLPTTSARIAPMTQDLTLTNLTLREDDGIGILTLNRPSKRNALDEATIEDLIAFHRPAPGLPARRCGGRGRPLRAP